ncbi:MAG: hypothetical protein ACU836_15615 [Gammaproteobacteria bacterium]
MAYFSKSISNPDLKATAIGLRNLENWQILKLRNISNQEFEWFDEEMLRQPENYELVFNGYGQSEIEMSEVNKDVFASDIHEITKHRFQVAVESKSLLAVDGGEHEADTLLERARAFTHQFAYFIITRDYESAVDTFSDYLRSETDESELKSQIEKVEKTYGDFELFDHVEVINLYNGPDGWKSALDTDWWPQATDKKARRAVAGFQLGSLVTPGGVILEGYSMSLSIIEENDSFKVHNYQLYSGK